ncbi:MAG TPA: hypothetical protein VF125_10705 [Solirubrobacterales bacterium]
MNKPEPDLSPLLPDDAILKARRAALVDALSPGGQGPRPGRGWRRRGPRLALGAAAAVAAVAAALIVSAGGDNPPAAFAVEPQEGGGVRIEVYSLEDADGLEQALEDAGIRAQVTWLPPGEVCSEPHFTPSRVKLPGGGSLGSISGGGPGAWTISVGSTQESRERFGEHTRGEISDQEYLDSTANFNLDPAAFRPDQSVVLWGSPRPFNGDPEGGHETHFAVAQGPVEPCNPVAAPAGSIGSIAIPPGAGAGASDHTPQAPPGPGQFLYTKTKVVQLQGWEPGGDGGGPRNKPRYFSANLLGPEGAALPTLVPTLKEVWLAGNGKTHERETLGRIRFLSQGDQRRWEEAGSPPPFAYDPAEHAVKRDRAGRPVKEYASQSWRGRNAFVYVRKLSRLPTEPEALRLAIENRRGGGSSVEAASAGSQRGAATAERLIEILGEPITSPELRAVALNALAEIPGIDVEHGVTDAVGRRGDAIVWVRERGFGHRVIFDPRTTRLLAQGEVIFDAEPAEYPGVPDGTVFRETAYLQSGIVDSLGERPAHGAE